MVCSRFVHWNIFGEPKMTLHGIPVKTAFLEPLFLRVYFDVFCVPFEASKLQSLFIVFHTSSDQNIIQKACLCPVEENKSYSFTMTRGWVKDVHFLGEPIKVTVPFHIIYTSNAKSMSDFVEASFFTEQSLTLHVTRLVRVGSDVQLSTLSSTDHAL